MNYCENCKLLCESDRCPVCGSKKTRAPEDKDFCFLIECQRSYGEILRQGLEDEQVPCALIPCGSGVRTAFGLELENYRVYVPYEHYSTAQEIVQFFSVDPTENLKRDLLEHFESWHVISSKAEKKLRKKLKLEKEAVLLDWIRDGVTNATAIKDNGPAATGPEGAHYLTVRLNDKTVWFNSVTYEILE